MSITHKEAKFILDQGKRRDPIKAFRIRQQKTYFFRKTSITTMISFLMPVEFALRQPVL